ncbi:MAG: ribosomal-processing cysteine protease Prp [bacterium]|jgi:uncharacterized protein YsxB (DUF464 family)
MVKILLTRNSQGQLIAFNVQGHAGCGAYGNDIVCAAVSVLAQTAVIGLEEYLRLKPQVKVEAGSLHCSLQEIGNRASETAAILETMVMGLRAIALDYPDNVCIVEEEVENDAED